MPIELFTGLPGNGKTAFMVRRLLEESKKPGARPLVACGIDGLQPGLATVLDDPRQWNAHGDAPGECDCHGDGVLHSHRIPDGALIFVDEAWKWFGHLQDAGRQATPPHVLALAEHRHRGIDFVWTTQQPSQIYPFARGLIATHYHHVRRFGTQFVDVFKWQELCEEVKSAAKREHAEKTTQRLPKESFGLYKSASEHTIKAKIPWKVWALPVLVVVAAALLYVAYSQLRPDAMAANLTDQGTQAPPGAAAPAEAVPQQRAGVARYETPEQYAAAHTPRIATIPGSAPIFDGRRPNADPQLFCMMSGAGMDALGKREPESCSCMTEQGTPYHVTPQQCEMVARQGAPYNPYKQQTRQVADREPEESSGAAASRGDAVMAAAMSAPQIGAYGDLAIKANPGSAP